MTIANDPEHFRDRWYSHIDELRKLKLSLPPEKMDDVDAIIEDAKDVVDQGAENVAED